MEQVTEAWIFDEPTAGDFVKIGYKQGANTKSGALSGTALHLLETQSSGDEAALNALLVRAVRNFILRSPAADVVVLNTPLNLS